MGRTLRIHGRVQRVCYRAWAAETARALGLAGWVRNRRDGSVELAAWGEEAALAALEERCRTGPPAARVDRIEIQAAQGEPPSGFEILRDA